MIICARRQAQLDEVAAKCKTANQEGGTGRGGLVQTVVLDVSNRSAVEGVLERLPEPFRRIDVLVNNAGTLRSLCSEAYGIIVMVVRDDAPSFEAIRGGLRLILIRLHFSGLVHGTEKVGEIKQSDIDTMFST